LPIGWFQCIDLKAEIKEEDDEDGEPKPAKGPLALKRVSTQKTKKPSSKNSSSKKNKEENK